MTRGVGEFSQFIDRLSEREKVIADLNKRIARLEADLLECREHLETEVDVIDGDYGVPAPNRAMALVTMIDESLNGAGR